MVVALANQSVCTETEPWRDMVNSSPVRRNLREVRGKVEDQMQTNEVTDTTEIASGTAKMKFNAQSADHPSGGRDSLPLVLSMDSGRNHVTP